MSISSRSSAYWNRSLHTLTLVRICAFVYITARGCWRRGALKTSAVWQNWQTDVSQEDGDTFRGTHYGVQHRRQDLQRRQIAVALLLWGWLGHGGLFQAGGGVCGLNLDFVAAGWPRVVGHGRLWSEGRPVGAPW